MRHFHNGSAWVAAVLFAFWCLIGQIHGLCDQKLYHKLQHFAPDVPTDDITVSSLSDCAGQCSGLGSDAMLMYNSDSMTCQCYGTPLAITNIDPGVPLYIANEQFPAVCDVSIVNGPGYRIDSSDITTVPGRQNGGGGCYPEKGRLIGSGSNQAWCSGGGLDPPLPWLQYDFREPRRVRGVRTQGRPSTNQYVKSFQLQFYSSGGWSAIRNAEGNNITFAGNEDGESIVYNEFPVSVVASKMRLFPLEYDEHCSTRLDFMGC